MARKSKTKKITVEIEVVSKAWTKVTVKVDGKEVPMENSYIRGELNAWPIIDFGNWRIDLVSSETG